MASAQNANVGSYKQEGFVEVLAATQSPRSTAWFQGTADAVRQYIWLFEDAMRNGVEDLLILSGNSAACHLTMQQSLRCAGCCSVWLWTQQRASTMAATFSNRLLPL